MKSICVVLLSVFAVAMCQDGCCMPEKLTANEGLVLSEVVDGVPRMIFGNIVLSMDETIRKINSEIHLYVGKKEVKERVLQDYTTKTQYLMQDGKCMKSQLGDWKAHCLTKNDSTFMSNEYFGIGTNTLDGSSYVVKGTGDVTAYVTVTREDPCVPIGELAFGETKGVPFFMSVGFSNMNSSIPDPSVFDIPAICQTAPTIPLVLYTGALAFHDALHYRDVTRLVQVSFAASTCNIRILSLPLNPTLCEDYEDHFVPTLPLALTLSPLNN